MVPKRRGRTDGQTEERVLTENAGRENDGLICRT